MFRFKTKPTLLTFALTGFVISIAHAQTSMTSLSDQQLSETTGQALLSLSYVSPSDVLNQESKRAGGDSKVGFYKLGMEAELELNANIKRLQLGCGGINGAGGCDIDIENLSLSGSGTTRDGRASSSAKLSNPFLEFAIKNPDSASTREMVGMRFSAEKIVGLLTTGTENSSTPNGINSLSGYMKVQSDNSGTIKGLANTASSRYNLYGSNQYGNLPVTGRLQALGLGGFAEVEFITSAGGFNIPTIKNNPFSTPAIVVNGKRISSVVLNSQVKVPEIILGDDKSGYATSGTVTYDPNTGSPTGIQTLGGKVEATVTTCSWIACVLAQKGSKFSNVYMSGKISGITANLTLNQSLGLIHSLPINSAMSLSLQSQPIKWMGSAAEDIAQTGWWLSATDPVNIGNVIPQDEIAIDQLYPQIATAVSKYLDANPAKTNDLGGLLKLGALTANIGTVDLSNTPLSLKVSNLTLQGQDIAPNCYGSLKFC